MERRPNQLYANAAIPSAIAAGHRNICVTGPTGSGKSLIIFDQIYKPGQSSALYTDRRMLLDQIHRGLDEHGIEHGIRAAKIKPRLLDDVQLCMTQTELSKCVKGNRQVHRCRLVLIDEAHKQAGDSMLALVEAHRLLVPDAAVLGFTATPLGIGHLYKHLIVAGTNSEMRKCGALVLAHHYGPDEPDTKWIGKIKIGEGECGIPNDKRMEFAHRVFGRVVENYNVLNPERKPALLFAPGVAESKWLCSSLTEAGISAAHIDGDSVVIDGQELENDPDAREEILDRSKSGDIKVVCNRFVLREGIDVPWAYHGIMATVFGSLTSYLQAGGRLLRAHPSMDHVCIQDHGGNWHRHGSLNSDRQWNLDDDDRIVSGMREARIRGKKDSEPIVCPKCNACRLSGQECWKCGFRYEGRTRIVLQRDGSLKEMRGEIYRARRILSNDQRISGEWESRVRAIRKSTKPSVMSMTFAQLEATFAKDHNWGYPPHSLPSMPKNDRDWFRKVRDVPIESLTGRNGQ